MKKIISLILCFSLLSLLTSCSMKDSPIKVQSNSIAEDVLGQEEITENIFRENTVIQELIFSDTVYEHIINENMITQTIIAEIVINEDTPDTIYAQLPDGLELYDVDWQGVLSKFAVGTAIILVVGVLTYTSMGTPVYYVFASALTEISKESLAGAVVGCISNVVMPYIKNGGVINEEVKKYAIEGAADGYMWGAISGLASSLVSGFTEPSPAVLYDKNNRPQYKIGDFGEVFTNNNATAEYYARTVNDYTYLIDYTGQVQSYYDDAGRLLNNSELAELPKIDRIRSTGRYSNQFDVDSFNHVSINEKIIGYLNDAYEIIGTGKYDGQLIGRINTSGKLVDNNWRAIQEGITFDTGGKITNQFKIHDYYNSIDRNLNKYNLSIVEDVVGADGNTVAYIVEHIDFDEIQRTYLISAGENKIIGLLDDYFHLSSNWNLQMSNLACNGVNQAESMVVQMIQNDIKFDYGPSFTDEVIKYVKENGRLPTGFQGHHINNVANYPFLANSPDNIIFYNQADHLAIGHNGNFHNSSSGALTTLAETFENIF